MPLLPSPRKRYFKTLFDMIAGERESWVKKNNYFHTTDRNYMQFLIPEGAKVLDLGCSMGDLLASVKPSYGVGIDFSESMVNEAKKRHPHLTFYTLDVEDTDNLIATIPTTFDFIILSDTIGFVDDCEKLLKSLHHFCHRDTRCIISYYSHLWEPLLKGAEFIKQKMPQGEINYLSPKDISNLLYLADFDTIKVEWRQLIPKQFFGLSTLINRYIAPLPVIRKLCLRHYIVARSLKHAPQTSPMSVTILIPCKNEKGNIETAITRLPRFCPNMEILFVEGNSSDGTYEECLRVQEKYKDTWDIKVYKQQGRGKGNAVRTGFELAMNDILMILDADLTMPPEELEKYYHALVSGKGEFINGSRLVYPMEKGAMRFLNYLANRFFAALFSFLLNQRFTDTLCGTKVLTRSNYHKIAANRYYFGEFDPFGDFDLIFGASKLGLKIAETPIRYADRTYGEPQISRFRDGFMLLRMVAFAWRKLKSI